MINKTPETTLEPAAREPAAKPHNLDRQYGDIGISAVAAALRYAGPVENAEPAAPAQGIDPRFIEASA